MDEGSQNDPPNNLDNSAEPWALQGNFQAPSPHAYTQPNSFPPQPELEFHPLYSPSPSAGLHTPTPFVNHNTGQQFNFPVLNYHHGTPGGRPTPSLPFPIAPGLLASTPGPLASTLGPLASTPGPIASTPQPEDASNGKKTQTQVQEKTVASKKGKGARSGKNARSGGHSDTEIKALDEKTKKAVDIVVPAKWDEGSALKLVEFITSPERWDKVATSLNKICQDVSLYNYSFSSFFSFFFYTRPLKFYLTTNTLLLSVIISGSMFFGCTRQPNVSFTKILAPKTYINSTKHI